MKKNLNVIPDNPDVVFVALNPTKKALDNEAVFSVDNALWNILVKAGFIKDVSDICLKERAKKVFGTEQERVICNQRLGIADLLDDVFETDSKKVKVPFDAVRKFFETNPQVSNTKKIVLLGQKVVDAFHKEFSEITSWREISKVHGGTLRSFGEIGKIIVNGNNIIVYAMPFPSSNNLSNKHEAYKKVLEEK